MQALSDQVAGPGWLNYLELFFEQLLLVQVRVVAPALDQLGVGTLLGYFTVFDDENLAGVPDGGNAVRDQNRGAAAHDILEGLENAFFGHCVDAGEGVVQDQNFRIAQDGPRDGDALFLAAG